MTPHTARIGQLEGDNITQELNFEKHKKASDGSNTGLLPCEEIDLMSNSIPKVIMRGGFSKTI